MLARARSDGGGRVGAWRLRDVGVDQGDGDDQVLAQSNGQGNPQLQAILDKFLQLNPDIKVDATYLPIGDDVREHPADAAAGRQRARRLLRHGRLRRPPVGAAAREGRLRRRPRPSGRGSKTLPLAPANRPLLLAPGQADRPAVRRRAGRRHVPRGRSHRPRDPGPEDDERVHRRLPHGEVEGQVLPQPRGRVARRTPRSSRPSLRRATCSRRIPAGT